MGGVAVTASARPAWPLRGWSTGMAWALWTLAVLGLAAAAWFDRLLRQAGRPELAQLQTGGGAVVLSAASAATAGAVLASRRPRHPVGWLLLAFGLVPQALSGAAEGVRPLRASGSAGNAAGSRAAGHAGLGDLCS